VNIYDQAAEQVRADHVVTTGPNGIGWGCSCGSHGTTPGPNATPGTTTAAANRHLRAAWHKALADLGR
jgi:6-phosphogluconate dehydrogenase